MLIKLTVENFRSYKNENSLLLSSSSKITTFPFQERVNNGLHVLKFAGIYGDNASGKTNFLKAALFLKTLVTSNVLSCRNFSFIENENEPTKIEVIFSTDHHIFQYGVKVMKINKPFPTISLVDEWLNIIGNQESHGKKVYSLAEGCNQSLFSSSDRTLFQFFQNGYKSIMATPTATPFLFYINSKDKIVPDSALSSIFQDAFSYIKNNIVVIDANSTNLTYIKDKTSLDTLLRYVKEFDPSIDSINFVEVPMEEISKALPQNILADVSDGLHRFPNMTINLVINNENYYFFSQGDGDMIKCETIEVKHRYIKTRFKFSDESEGTKKFIILMSSFSDHNSKKVFFVDELERSMHPSSSKYILDFFASETKNSDTQFIFTTHNPSFMKTNLRRDEIFFAEKDPFGESVIYPLTDFYTRSNSPLDKMFLEGAFRKLPPAREKEFEDC